MNEKIRNFFKNNWFVLAVLVAFGTLVFVGLRGLRGHLDIDVIVKKNNVSWLWSKEKK